MKSIIVKKLSDVDELEAGTPIDFDRYANWPDPPQNEKEADAYGKKFLAALKKRDSVVARIEKAQKARTRKAASKVKSEK